MKKVKNICLISILVLIAFVMSACSKKLGIIGTWTYESGDYTYTFSENGTGEYNGTGFTYTLDGEKISILFDSNTAPFETTYSINGNRLNVKDISGNDMFYIRK